MKQEAECTRAELRARGKEWYLDKVLQHARFAVTPSILLRFCRGAHKHFSGKRRCVFQFLEAMHLAVTHVAKGVEHSSSHAPTVAPTRTHGQPWAGRGSGCQTHQVEGVTFLVHVVNGPPAKESSRCDNMQQVQAQPRTTKERSPLAIQFRTAPSRSERSLQCLMCLGHSVASDDNVTF